MKKRSNRSWRRDAVNFAWFQRKTELDAERRKEQKMFDELGKRIMEKSKN